MKAFLILLVVSGALSLPAKLDDLIALESRPRGYDYSPPEQPANLYEIPQAPATTTTVAPPSGLYLTPDELPAPDTPHVDVVLPDMPMMLMPYNIDWAVEDEESGNRFHHVEDSDGQNVKGEYSVMLPDGRLQMVRFTADPVNGYRAEVTYDKDQCTTGFFINDGTTHWKCEEGSEITACTKIFYKAQDFT